MNGVGRMRSAYTGFQHFICPVCGATTRALVGVDEDERAERLEAHFAKMHSYVAA